MQVVGVPRCKTPKGAAACSVPTFHLPAPGRSRAWPLSGGPVGQTTAGCVLLGAPGLQRFRGPRVGRRPPGPRRSGRNKSAPVWVRGGRFAVAGRVVRSPGGEAGGERPQGQAGAAGSGAVAAAASVAGAAVVAGPACCLGAQCARRRLAAGLAGTGRREGSEPGSRRTRAPPGRCCRRPVCCSATSRRGG